ncbi:hypothetical protein L9F63_002819, partial [Diploptera punctata]
GTDLHIFSLWTEHLLFSDPDGIRVFEAEGIISSYLFCQIHPIGQIRLLAVGEISRNKEERRRNGNFRILKKPLPHRSARRASN